MSSLVTCLTVHPESVPHIREDQRRTWERHSLTKVIGLMKIPDQAKFFLESYTSYPMKFSFRRESLFYFPTYYVQRLPDRPAGDPGQL